MQENLCQKLRNYNSEDIFNCNEMNLFWKLRLSHTILNRLVFRTKQSKECITILLTCNAIDNEKLPSLFIYKYENPQTLKNIDKKNLLVDYYWNQKSWMQISIWNKYIKKLNSRIQR